MQEPHPYKTTAQQGWSQMLPILEEHMPVKKRRRFIFFMWTSAAIISSALIASFVLLSPDKLAMQSVAHVGSHIPGGQQSPSADLSAEKSASDNNTVSNNTILPELKKEEGAPASSSAIPSTYEQAHSGKHKTEIIHHVSAGTTTDHVSLSDVIKSQSLYDVSDPTADASSPSSFVDEVHQMKGFVIAPIDPMPLSESLKHAQQPEMIKVANADTRRKYADKKFITPHAFLSFAEGHLEGIGAHGGVGLDLNLTRRLSLTSELGYAVYKPEVALFRQKNEDIQSDVLQNFQGIGDYLPAEIVTAADGNTLTPFVQTVRQWQFHAGVKYDISRRFFIQGGAVIGFATTAKSAYPIIELDELYSGVSDPFVARNTFNAFELVNTTMTSLTAGLGYRTSRHFEIYGQWTQALDPYLVNPNNFSTTGNRSDYMSGLNVGMRYSL